jgi:2,3-bisphosphoglycerate-independent phosphoglycerate mutase
MIRILICPVVFVLLLTSVGLSDTAQVAIVVIEGANRDKNEISFKATQTAVSKSVDPNGKMVISTKVDPQIITESIDGMTAMTTDGKALSQDELWKRLTPRAVVIVGDEEIKQEQIRKAFSPEVTVLIRKNGFERPKTKTKSAAPSTKKGT